MAKKSVTLGTHWEAKMKSTGDTLGTQGRAARRRPPPSFSSTSNCTQAGVVMSVCVSPGDVREGKRLQTFWKLLETRLRPPWAPGFMGAV